MNSSSTCNQLEVCYSCLFCVDPAGKEGGEVGDSWRRRKREESQGGAEEEGGTSCCRPRRLQLLLLQPRDDDDDAGVGGGGGGGEGLRISGIWIFAYFP